MVAFIIYFTKTTIEALNCQINSPTEDNQQDNSASGLVLWLCVCVEEVPCVGAVCGVVWCRGLCVRDVLCACCVCVGVCVLVCVCGGVCVVVVWHAENPVCALKTSPCVRSKRSRVYRQHAHMFYRQFCLPKFAHVGLSRAAEVHHKKPLDLTYFKVM